MKFKTIAGAGLASLVAAGALSLTVAPVSYAGSLFSCLMPNANTNPNNSLSDDPLVCVVAADNQSFSITARQGGAYVLTLNLADSQSNRTTMWTRRIHVATGEVYTKRVEDLYGDAYDKITGFSYRWDDEL